MEGLLLRVLEPVYPPTTTFPPEDVLLGVYLPEPLTPEPVTSELLLIVELTPVRRLKL